MKWKQIIFLDECYDFFPSWDLCIIKHSLTLKNDISLLFELYHFYNLFIYPHTVINPITIKFLSRKIQWLGKCFWVVYHCYSTEIKIIIVVECEEVAMISTTKQLQNITFHSTFWYLGPLYPLKRSTAKSLKYMPALWMPITNALS